MVEHTRWHMAGRSQLDLRRWTLRLATISLLSLCACEPTEQPPNAPESVPSAVPLRQQKQSPGVACGEVGCRLFPSSIEALSTVLASNPRVIGIGEAHSLKGQSAIPATATQFARRLLPKLAPRSSHLILELMAPNPECRKKNRAVRKAQQPITKSHSLRAQHEYVTLGKVAKKLGIEPELLKPSCQDLNAIANGGEGSMLVMLKTIVRLTREQVTAHRHSSPSAQPFTQKSMIIAYGGAMHNDIEPRGGRAEFSFGPALADATDGAYVELDLIVPEFIKSTSTWTALPWYQHYDPEKFGDRAVLFQPSHNSFVLVLPLAAKPPAPALNAGTPSSTRPAKPPAHDQKASALD